MSIMTLKELRIRRNYSQKQLAYYLGCTYQTIICWEKHKTRISTNMLQKLIDLFGERPSDLEEAVIGEPKHSEAYYLNGIKDTEGQEHTFRYLRMRLRLTQAEVAQKLGINRMTYNRWETYKQPLISESFYQPLLGLFGEIPIGIAFSPYHKSKVKRGHMITGDNILRLTKSQKLCDGVPDGVPYIIIDEENPHIYRPGLVQYKYADDEERIAENRAQWEEDQKHIDGEY